MYYNNKNGSTFNYCNANNIKMFYKIMAKDFYNIENNDKKKEKLLNNILSSKNTSYAIKWAKEVKTHEDEMLDIVISSKNAYIMLDWAKEVGTHLEEIGKNISNTNSFNALYNWCRIYHTHIEKNAHTIFIKNPHSYQHHKMIKKWLTNINYINYEIADNIFNCNKKYYQDDNKNFSYLKYFKSIYPILTIEKTNDAINYAKKYIYNQLLTNNILEDYYDYLRGTYKSYNNIIRKIMKDLNSEEQLGIIL